MVEFYYAIYSPSCQSVMLLAKDLGINLNKKEIKIMNGDHLTPEYLKMNPQHTIPTIKDNGFCLWESRAILAYLVDKYAKDHSLNPEDPQKRAVVNQRLYFDSSILFPKFYEIASPMLRKGEDVDQNALAAYEDTLKLLDKFLEGHDWVCGDHITIADYSMVPNVSVMELFGYDLKKHPNTSRWLENARRTMKGYDDIISLGHGIMKKNLTMAKKAASGK